MSDSVRAEFENLQDTITENIRDLLEETGEIDELKMKLRQKIFNFVNRDGDNPKSFANPQENKHSSIQLLNSMIKEYFEWGCLMYSLEMFKTETGDRSDEEKRENLEAKIAKKNGSGDFDPEIPLLLQIVMESMK
jgi:hypothetical protein